MKVNNASLTGESEDINIYPEKEPQSLIFETKNVGFFGTYVFMNFYFQNVNSGLCFIVDQ